MPREEKHYLREKVEIDPTVSKVKPPKYTRTELHNLTAGLLKENGINSNHKEDLPKLKQVIDIYAEKRTQGSNKKKQKELAEDRNILLGVYFAMVIKYKDIDDLQVLQDAISFASSLQKDEKLKKQFKFNLEDFKEDVYIRFIEVADNFLKKVKNLEIGEITNDNNYKIISNFITDIIGKIELIDNIKLLTELNRLICDNKELLIKDTGLENLLNEKDKPSCTDRIEVRIKEIYSKKPHCNTPESVLPTLSGSGWNLLKPEQDMPEEFLRTRPDSRQYFRSTEPRTAILAPVVVYGLTPSMGSFSF